MLSQVGSEAGKAMNPDTLAKNTYNPALPPNLWALIKKLGCCYHCFGPFGPNHVYPNADEPSTDVTTREVGSDDVINLYAMSDSPAFPSPGGSSDIDTLNIVGDELETLDGDNTLHASEPQTVSQPVTVDSSLDVIAAICDGVGAMDLQMDSHTPPRKQNQTLFVGKTRIWVPTPKT